MTMDQRSDQRVEIRIKSWIAIAEREKELNEIEHRLFGNGPVPMECAVISERSKR